MAYRHDDRGDIVMSRYIKQDDLFELVRTGVLVSNSNFESVCKYIGSLPTIDIVRCGECKFWKESRPTSEDDFCSCGVRRDNE